MFYLFLGLFQINNSIVIHLLIVKVEKFVEISKMLIKLDLLLRKC